MNTNPIETAVEDVVANVRERGDAALLEYTAKWDRVELTPSTLRVPTEAIERADTSTPFAQSFARAVDRIRAFHEQVRPRTTLVEDDEGVRMGIRWTALAAAGLYVPGGKASYPSTLAMTAVPAQIAGVERIVVVSPPGPSGEVCEEVLLAAKIVGLDEVYRVGGAQAIAALAIGTDTVPRVDKIFGPGNAFVAEAKKQLYGEVGIDMLAGPSEVVVYCDHVAEPDWVASDLMAQAEHDEDTRCTLLASSADVLRAVRVSMDRLVEDEPRKGVILASWKNNGRFEVVADASEAARRIDAIAPEHLSLQVEKPWDALSRIRNAGAIFLGPQSPVAVGDYYAGPNHVLPTGTTARFSSCLSVEDFMKRSNVCELSAEFLRDRCGDVEVLAAGERLPAHATSVRVRRADVAQPRARRGVRAAPPYHLVEEDAETKLNQNESPWDVPAEIKEEVARRLAGESWNRYHQKLPEELCARIAADAKVDSKCVLASSGSNLLLQWIFSAFSAPGATILTPEPSFSLYPLWAGVSEAVLRTVPLRTNPFAFDVAAFEAAVLESRPAITVLCLPNNPTGTELETASVRQIAMATRAVGGVLVIDEAYQEFSPERFDRTSLASEFDNVILVRTFSKAFAAAGMRVGYAIASVPLAEQLHKMVPPFHLNLFAAVLGLTVLDRADVFRERVATIVDERGRLTGELAKCTGVEALPSEANFFLVRSKDPGRLYDGLAERGILVRKPSGGAALAGCLRINVGTPEENDRLLAAVREIL